MRTLSIATASAAIASGIAYLASGVMAAGRPSTPAEEEAWAKTIAKKKGWIVMPSGLMIHKLKDGDRSTDAKNKSPLPGTSTSCHYQGWLVNTKNEAGDFKNSDTFDSSVKRGAPLDFAPNQVVSGWTEAMQMMVEGDKWRLVLPPKLGYGASGAGGSIPGNAHLIFEMEMMKIKGNGKQTPKPIPAANETDEL